MSFDPDVSRTEDSNSEREALRGLVRSWVELRERELVLLRRLERLLGGEGLVAPGDALQIVPSEAADAGSTGGSGLDPLHTEILHVLETTFPPERPQVHGEQSAFEGRSTSLDLRLLLVRVGQGAGEPWRAIPWDEVACVRLPEDRAGAAALEGTDGFEIVWCGGAGVLTVSGIGQLVTLEDAVEMGIEEALTHPEPPDPEPLCLALIDLVARGGGVRSGVDASAVEGVPGGAPKGNGNSALVVVRYLPARVALARALRAGGWDVLEEADPAANLARVRERGVSLLFLEAAEAGDFPAVAAAREARDAGVTVIEVASRYRAEPAPPASLGDVPRLLHPFAEGEIEALLERLSRL